MLTLTERKTRREFIAKIADKTVESVKSGLKRIFRRMGQYKKIVKSITSDNGSEFARLYELEKTDGIQVYYAHPYSAYERGTNENCNRLIRRHIPKGKYVKRYSHQKIRYIEDWINEMPRRLFGGKCAAKMYAAELLKLGIAVI